MERSDFYITCPSNASMSIYPNNTQASFTINLPKRLYLQSKYEVGLAEIQYPISWKSLKDHETIDVQYGNVQDKIQLVGLKYNNLDELLHVLRNAIFELNKKHGFRNTDFKIEVQRFWDKVHFVTSKTIKFRLSQGYAEALGFEPNVWMTGAVSSKYQPDVHRGFNALYIYCNIVDSQIVGDVYAPLLRTVAIRGNRGQVINESFDRIHYVPVNTDEVSTIEINIKDDTGDDVSFQSGKVICKLHLRQKSI